MFLSFSILDIVVPFLFQDHFFLRKKNDKIKNKYINILINLMKRDFLFVLQVDRCGRNALMFTSHLLMKCTNSKDSKKEQIDEYGKTGLLLAIDQRHVDGLNIGNIGKWMQRRFQRWYGSHCKNAQILLLKLIGSKTVSVHDLLSSRI